MTGEEVIEYYIKLLSKNPENRTDIINALKDALERLDILEIIAEEAYEVNFITTFKNEEYVDKVKRYLNKYRKEHR